MKKRKKITIVILTIIVGLLVFIKVSGYDQAIMYIWLSSKVSKVNNFNKNQNDYQAIADKIIELKNNGTITNDKDRVYVENGKMYDADFVEIKLSESEIKSLIAVAKTFDVDYPLDMIEIFNDKYISFSVSTYPFGVIYSKDGSQPKGLGLLDDEERNYKVKMIAPKWYTVEEKMN